MRKQCFNDAQGNRGWPTLLRYQARHPNGAVDMRPGVAAYVLIQIARELPSLFSSADQANWGSVALGLTLIAAGLYQFTPLKRICLRHCRSPLAFVAQHWRDGKFGALAMGLKHGTLLCRHLSQRLR